jgi:ABC-type multidrug transport system permease subunit
MFNGFRGVLYRELKVYQRRFKKQFLSSSIAPLLYLIAFGWGFGRDVTVEGLTYISFLIPGLVTMASLNQSFSIAQELNISRFYFHTFDEYMLAPISHNQIILGEAAYGMLKGAVSMLLILVYAILFKVKFYITVWFLLALALHTFVFGCLGVTISMIVRDHGDQAMVNNFVITPMIFLCGTFFPVNKLPGFFQWIVYALPLTYSTKIIRSTLTGRCMEWDLFFVLAGFAALFFITAKIALKRVEV